MYYFDISLVETALSALPFNRLQYEEDVTWVNSRDFAKSINSELVNCSALSLNNSSGIPNRTRCLLYATKKN